MQIFAGMVAMIKALMEEKKMPKEKKIQIKCTGSHFVELKDLTPFQGDLKTITDENLDKLKRSILKEGFCTPIYIWKSNKKNYIIDAHQREKALNSLQEEGYSIPKLPVVIIEAKTKTEIKRKLLQISSQYGDFNKDELVSFIDGLKIELQDFSLKDIKLKDIDIMINKKDIKINEKELDILETENKCPKCGYEW